MRSVKGFVFGLLLVVLAGGFTLGLHGVAGADTLPGCSTYPDPTPCGPPPTVVTNTTFPPAQDVTKDDDGTLPFTGSDVVQIVVAGGALLFIGYGLVVITRRKP